MPRSKIPTPKIPAMRALLKLYELSRGISQNPQQSEKDYVASLTKHLKDDGVIDGQASVTLVAKIRSQPLPARNTDVEGIAEHRLDIMAKVVLRHFNLPGSHSYPWQTFSTELFPTPNHMRHIDDRKYYKYLFAADKVRVDGYVQRLMDAYDIDKTDIASYTVYNYNERDKATHLGILQINKSRKYATFTYYNNGDSELSVRSVLRTNLAGHEDGYFLANHALNLSFREENEDLNYLRLTIQLAVHDANFTGVAYLRGTYLTCTEHGAHPTTGVISCELKASFAEAKAVVADKSEWNNLLCFDVMTSREVVKEQSLVDETRFNSFLGHQVVRLVAGAYRFAFVSQISARNAKGYIVIGNCFIQEDGIVMFQSNGSLTTKAYIENKNYLGSEGVCIAVFSPEGADAYKMHYQLKIEPDFNSKGERIVKRLIGTFAGLVRGMTSSGDVVFLPKPAITSFEQLKTNFDPVSFNPNDKEIEDSLSDEQREFKNLLKGMQDERPRIN